MIVHAILETPLLNDDKRTINKHVALQDVLVDVFDLRDEVVNIERRRHQ